DHVVVVDDHVSRITDSSKSNSQDQILRLGDICPYNLDLTGVTPGEAAESLVFGLIIAGRRLVFGVEVDQDRCLIFDLTDFLLPVEVADFRHSAMNLAKAIILDEEIGTSHKHETETRNNKISSGHS